MIPYDKLVRDRIPEIVARDGKRAITRVLGETDYAVRLDAKLAEEVAEYAETQATEELIDLLEVIRAIATHRHIEWDELERLRREKAARRGGFAQRLLLTGITDASTGPDMQTQLKAFFHELVSANPDFAVGPSPTTGVNFTLQEWDRPLATLAESWKGKRGHLLYFFFRNDLTRPRIDLLVGPGRQDRRQVLIEAARTAGPPFVVPKGKTSTWSIVFTRRIPHSASNAEATLESVMVAVRQAWTDFVERDVPGLRQALIPIIATLEVDAKTN